ncbi:MAG: dTMP kinase [Candidatus Methanomethylophilaceae archaeon]|nr:dTMP kinase [Candidatus Methanomethylophilaceae archaeon]MDD3378716.1 dTMP kinase [Candidatus Methanomethylophilaceae archaeon]MDY0224172.1 dTMP kinase [Candidatus Methanomethylophilaceae archaeon]
MTGLFIVFEGIDGSGKTTLCEKIHEALVSEGKKVVITQEPTHDEIGTFIRDGIVKDISQKAEALLFVADRAVHTDRISAWVDANLIVLCDRYFASTIAYQSVPLNDSALDWDWLLALNKPVTRKPDITFLLDIDVDKSMKRVHARGEKGKFENIEYQRNVRLNYLKLAKQFDFTIVNADRDLDEIAKEVLKEIKEKI